MLCHFLVIAYVIFFLAVPLPGDNIKPPLYISTESCASLLQAEWQHIISLSLHRVAQSVTCLATDACLTADPGVASSIPVWSHTFVDIDHEMIYTVILLPSADSFEKGCCQLQAQITG